MNPKNMSSYSPYSASPTDVMRQQGIMTQVYAWMTAGLLVTGAIALFTANSPALSGLVHSPLFFVLIILELGMVFFLSARIGKIAPGLATGLFLGYSVLNGLTISFIFLYYTSASIASTFFVTAGMFGVMSLYGYTTKRDLSGIGQFLVMALIGFLLASVVNIFLANEMIYWITTYAGVLIFVGLTAWDTQKIKHMTMQVRDEDGAHRVAIMGALMLYLDFINMFLLLLRILGNRR
jgi:hypothetical protein